MDEDAPVEVYTYENLAVPASDAEASLLDAAKVYIGGASNILITIRNLSPNPCTVRIKRTAGHTQAPLTQTPLGAILGVNGTHAVEFTRNAGAYLAVTGQCGPGLAATLEVAVRATCEGD